MLKTPIFRYCTLCFFAVPLRPVKVANTTVLSLVMTTRTNMKPDYGNWVPKRLLYGLLIAVLITTALLIGALTNGWAWPWIALVAILLVVSAGFLCYMTVLYHVFSFSGGGLMGRVHEYVANHLPWDGRGRLLDVGCGAGALTIRCAKKYPEACCVGIDYWGIKWDYSQRMCQHNAEAEEVADRCIFQHGDANHLDFPDGSFDAVVSNFVYHEINDGKSREELLRETLRVLKPGGSFALQDLFGLKSAYGDFQGIIERLQTDTVSEIHYADSATEIPIPKWLRVSGMMPGVGIIYGKK